ncbi:MAG TPA: hypothetical protein VNJ01_09460 [Bacteriovoracaceae bacterium]|nr:hypothetical protein [Bacteriovoracaceae bacterium]
MLIVQKFHSIHEIDPEFISNIEVLLQEDVASFSSLVEKHDTAPEGDVFTYFLFFGPTQNAPIGFAQLCLKKVPYRKILPWHRRLAFWKREHEHWKQINWQVGDGSTGMCVFDPRFARSGKEQVQKLIKEYEGRRDIVAQNLFCLKGLQDFQVSWEIPPLSVHESFILEPLAKASKSYQDYLLHLKPETQKQIKNSWKALKKNHVDLGDYPSVTEAPAKLPIKPEQLDAWKKSGVQILTFEKDGDVLGCLQVLRGKNGNVFFEPFLFESEKNSVIPDELYTQYALLKFFELPECRKCHLMKFGNKVIFDDKEELKFFLDQGFQSKTVTRSFYSRLPELTYSL